MKKIVVVGSINMDFVTKVQRHPGVGETVHGWNLMLNPGGKGANQACAAARLGGDVTMLGAVGNDESGHQLIQSLRKAGVHTEYIKVEKEIGSGAAFVTVNEEGDNSIIAVSGANQTVDRAYIDSVMDVIEASDIVIFQLEIPTDTVVYAAQKAKRLGKMVILDPTPAQRLPEELLDGMDIVKPNQMEVMKITEDRSGIQDRAELENLSLKENRIHKLEIMKSHGVKCPVITLGSDGCCAMDETGELVEIPAVSVEAVDTTGAGDCFTGVLAFSLAKGSTLAEGLALAVKASAISVTRSGAQLSFPTYSEMMADF